jgi:hypothetical protein
MERLRVCRQEMRYARTLSRRLLPNVYRAKTVRHLAHQPAGPVRRGRQPK